MEIEYTPKEEDLIAIAKCQLEKSNNAVSYMRRFQKNFIVGLLLMCVGIYMIIGPSILLFGFAVLIPFVGFVYPSFHRWRLKKNIPTIIRRKATAMSYAHIKLKALPDGLVQSTELTQSRIDWSLINGVHEDHDYLYIVIDGTYSIVIPRNRIALEDYAAFLTAVQTYRASAV